MPHRGHWIASNCVQTSACSNIPSMCQNRWPLTKLARVIRWQIRSASGISIPNMPEISGICVFSTKSSSTNRPIMCGSADCLRYALSPAPHSRSVPDVKSVYIPSRNGSGAREWTPGTRLPSRPPISARDNCAPTAAGAWKRFFCGRPVTPRIPTFGHPCSCRYSCFSVRLDCMIEQRPCGRKVCT